MEGVVASGSLTAPVLELYSDEPGVSESGRVLPVWKGALRCERLQHLGGGRL